MDEILTTVQAGRELGVTPLRVRQFILEGRLPALKPGREYLIMRRDLEALERRRVGRPPRRTS